ncbi:hypothetical protein ScPMuIL_004065 [Solemya velum]
MRQSASSAFPLCHCGCVDLVHAKTFGIVRLTVAMLPVTSAVLVTMLLFAETVVGIVDGTSRLMPEPTERWIDSGSCSTPPVCDCIVIRGRLTANCSSRNINSTTIPSFRRNVHTIILNSNKITEMPNNSFFQSQLSSLHIQQNNMSEIQSGAFLGLKSLKVLDLAHNQLTTKPGILKKDVFQDLKQLQILHIHNNSIRGQPPVDYPDSACANLVSLTNITIDGQVNASFGKGFSSLDYLKHLDFSGSSGKCKIHNLKSTTFQHLSHLETIDATFCNIVNTERNTFSSLKNLTHLKLSNNVDLGFKILRNISLDSVTTSIKVIELNKVYRTFGLGTIVNTFDIEAISNTSLEVLSLESNRLQMLQYGVASLMPETLRKVSFADNKMLFGWFVFEIERLTGLQEFNLSNQVASHVPSDLNTPFTYDGAKECREHQGRPDRMATYNDLNQVTRFQRDLAFRCIKMPPSLEIVDLTSSYLKYSIMDLCFETNNIRKVFLANNIINKWIGGIKGLTKIEHLDMSKNFCSEVSYTFFDNLTNLKTLLIAQNFLGFSLRTDDNGRIFKNLRRLQKLDISDNRIDRLPKFIFRGLESLEMINLGNNSLTECNFNIGHMSKLKHIDMSFNQLSTIPNHFLIHLDQQLSKNITVNMKGNPLVCSCASLKFLEWFKERKTIFMFSKDYYCTYDGREQKLEEINLTELKKTCVSYTGVIIAAIVIILLAISSIIGGLVYRFRWKLRYFYYMAKSKYMGYTQVQRENEDDFVYDAFVSYSDLQRTFVIKDMIDHLEKDGGLSLCIHHRDFLPGNEIGANITDAIHKSRRIVAVVSRDFLESYWCMFELNMARMESIYSRDGRNNLFLIMYENDIPTHLPLEFYDLIESNSYIEYPDDPQGNIVFWDNVHKAMLS